MIVGIPRETKADERRVSLTPDKVDLMVRHGHQVVIEANAGAAAGFNDDRYRAVGATIVETPDEVFSRACMVVKVKEPQPQEYPLLRENQVLFTFLHLAAQRRMADAMLASRVTGVAYETVQEDDGDLPLLYPMSEIAGRLAPQVAARLMESTSGGPGKLLGGVPGTMPLHTVIIGGGTVGFNAAIIAEALGSRVTIADINLERLRYIGLVSHGSINTVVATPANVADLVRGADIVVGAVLVPGARAPKVVTRDMVRDMPGESLVVDVAVDQGGSVETTRPTSHHEPTFTLYGVTHYAVPNMPAIAAHTASVSLSNATYPYVLKLANSGLRDAVSHDNALARGVNTLNGRVTHEAVAKALDVEYVPLQDALDARERG